MSLTTCPCGQLFAHLPLPGEALSALCYPCAVAVVETALRAEAVQRSESVTSGNGAGTYDSPQVATSRAAETGLKIDEAVAADTRGGLGSMRRTPNMAKVLETRKGRARAAAQVHTFRPRRAGA
jgi:hypothetical protein